MHVCHTPHTHTHTHRERERDHTHTHTLHHTHNAHAAHTSSTSAYFNSQIIVFPKGFMVTLSMKLILIIHYKGILRHYNECIMHYKKTYNVL